MVGTTKPAVYKWIAGYEQQCVDGLSDRVSTGRSPEISAEVRARILALTRQSPAEETGLSHWLSRKIARYLKREMDLCVAQLRGRVVARIRSSPVSLRDVQALR
jgi:transposase